MIGMRSDRRLILGLETSCDDTCAAVVDGAGAVLSNVVSSQLVHERFGGVVPEIASRHHVQLVNLVAKRALEEAGVALESIDVVAVTQRPGLIGALLVGLSTAKALAGSRRLPMAAVDHLQGHVAANFLTLPELEPLDPPFVCLIASGGHTLIADVRHHDRFSVLGTTLDDAAGEAFDKGARMLGLGFPGGPALERLAKDGDTESFEFPVPGRRRPGGGVGREAFARSLDFSFAGVKTALWQRVHELSEDELDGRRADLAASFQAAIVDALTIRVRQALESTGLDRLAVGGGVAANGALRARLRDLGTTLHVPPPALCTDNAAMIASAARYSAPTAYPDYLGFDAFAGGELRAA
jgi:N6-L-threonylcarbamoyladenine synthase